MVMGKNEKVDLTWFMIEKLLSYFLSSHHIQYLITLCVYSLCSPRFVLVMVVGELVT